MHSTRSGHTHIYIHVHVLDVFRTIHGGHGIFYGIAVQPSPKKSVRKAVSLVSLSSVDTTKASTSKARGQRMDYSVVTQVLLCLEPDQCNVRSVGGSCGPTGGVSCHFT